MIQPFNQEGVCCEFMGFPMLQNRYAVPFWSYVFEKERPTDVIELGTWEGGFTSCLGVAARNHGTRLHTFGREDINPRSVPWFEFLRIRSYQGDVFSERCIDALIHICERAEGTTVILCDNGDKRMELKTFANLLRRGDIIAAHDFQNYPWWACSEINEQDMEDCMNRFGLERYMPEEAAQAGWIAGRKI